MAKKLFDINVAGKTPDWKLCRLFLEAGRHNFLYVVMDAAKEVVHLSYYEVEGESQPALAQEIREIIDAEDVLKQHFRETVVLYNFPESQFIPEAFFNVNINADMDGLVQGDLNRGIRLSEKLQGYNLYNVFHVPAELHQLLKEQYRGNQYWHYYTWWMKCSQAQLLPALESMQVVFYPAFILVAAVKDKQLQLVQQFNYHTAEDVVYHLLNTCAQLRLEPANVQVRLAGMIDASSAVFNEIQKYFGNASPDFYPAISSTPELQEYPSHFFSPILKLAACAS
jgi:hypothetical protein